MSVPHFDVYQARDASDFFMHAFLRLKKESRELPLRETLKEAADKAYHRRLTSGDDKIVNPFFRLEDEFFQRLRSKITPELTWENCIGTVNEAIAEINNSLRSVS